MDQPAGLDRVIATANGKGGVLKTSVTTSVSGLAAAAGWRTLIVDLDPQGNCTEDLGLADITDEGAATVAAVTSHTPLQPQPTGRVGLDICLGGFRLHDITSLVVGREMRGDASAQHSLAAALAPVVGEYDLVLIDCPPNEASLQTLALTAARWVIIPTKSDDSSRKGLREIARRFELVHRRNPTLQLLGVVLTGVNASARVVRAEAKAEIEQDLGGAAPLFEATIRHVESTAKAVRRRGMLPHELEVEVAAQQPWWQALKDGAGKDAGQAAQRLPASASSLAGDYAALTREVLELVSAAGANLDDELRNLIEVQEQGGQR